MRLCVLFTLCALCSGSGFECGTPQEVRKFFRLSSEKSDQQTPAQYREELEQWIARYPRVWELRENYIRASRFGDRERWPAKLSEFVKEAEASPENVLALTVAAMALQGADTPKAIALLERAQTVAPGDPVSALQLSRIYQLGRFANKEKSREYFEIYAKGCPGHVDGQVSWVMGKAAPVETQARMAQALRQRLEKSTAPEDVAFYETLWGLEFRTRPPAEHPALRKQVAADVARIEKAFPSPDGRMLAVMKSGARQSGASKDELEQYNLRIQQLAPASSAAYTAAWEAWKENHKEPEKHDDVAGWTTWKRAYFAALSEWKDKYSEVRWLKDSWLELGAELKLIDEKTAMPLLLKPIEEKERKRQLNSLWDYLNAARVVLDNRWEAARAMAWLEKAWQEAILIDQFEDEDDTRSDADRRDRLERGGYRSWVAYEWLRAAQAAGGGKAPPDMRAWIERPAPAKATRLPDYFDSRARLAAIEERRADALTYFQQALLAREEAPRMYRGKLEDPLLDDAKAYFLANGGSEAAFALWSTPRTAKAGEPAQGRWETPQKDLPAFELSDLSGRTWKLKQLEGKALLINLWATWCGPCRAELPHFQKLYEKTKSRTDVQVLTFNMDEEVGLVEPYMKENGYTFPVLLAYQLVRGLLDNIVIPQNWLVDSKGKWKATQLGFDATDVDWVNNMVSKLESARVNQ